MTKTYTYQDLKKMPLADAMLILSKACKVTGTALVRRADGTIKYDDQSKAGEYGEKDGS